MAILSGDYYNPIIDGKNTIRPEDIDMTPPKKVVPEGCRVFNIEGYEIVALNEKSAMKKYKKLIK